MIANDDKQNTISYHIFMFQCYNLQTHENHSSA